MANDEQSDAIEEAIKKALPSIEGHKDGDMLIDWVLVAYVDNPDDSQMGAYPMFYSNGEMPNYHAVGLLTVGLSCLNENHPE